jgi:hypothetical protein
LTPGGRIVAAGPDACADLARLVAPRLIEAKRWARATESPGWKVGAAVFPSTAGVERRRHEATSVPRRTDFDREWSTGRKA